MGFRIGALKRKSYKIGDSLDWQTPEGVVCRPAERPVGGNIKTVGYFNCDNPKCSSWQDCFPAVQMALVTIEGGCFIAVESYDPPAQIAEFAILEMD